MRSARQQSGLSILSFLFVAAVVVVVAVVGFRVLPAYIEYFSVKSALVETLAEMQDFNNPTELRKNFQKRVDAGYIESVGGRDIDLHKEGNQWVATLAWTRKLPLVSNVSLLIEFETRAER
jgi:Tfp pilus assembly major pilin PilA